MWPSEYEMYEHRKEMQRIAAQITLARLVQTQPPLLTRWLNRLFVPFRRPQQTETEPVHTARPYRTVVRRAS